jgi:5-methylcytosine-specific restriction endonuclease McrA
MTSKWFENRFTERKSAIKCDCEVCGTSMWFPPSKAGKYATCGGACADKRIELKRKDRERNCLTCGKLFTARLMQIKNGGGKYCCNKCALPVLEKGRTQESHAKALETRRKGYAEGRLVAPRGEKSHRWKGGKDATKKRQVAKDPLNIIRREKRRQYMAKNKARAKEWLLRRKSRKIGRLPKGTVQSIGDAQKWKCVVCRCDIKSEFSVDHITALAKGGKHESSNIQLLCRSCNSRKSAKDPIKFMQQMGFLL